MDVLAKGLHWVKGLCHLPCKERWESRAFLDCFLGLRNKIEFRSCHEDALSSYTPKMPRLSLISDCSCSQVGEQSYPCSCPGEKIMRAGVKYSPSFYSGICEIVPSHPVFFNHWFWSTRLCQMRKEPKYLGQWETKNLAWFWVVWWGFLRIGAKGITLHLASLPVSR